MTIKKLNDTMQIEDVETVETNEHDDTQIETYYDKKRQIYPI